MLEDSIDDVKVYVGQSDKDNHELVIKSKSIYYWFHLKNFPSPHVVIETSNPTKQQLYYCANLVKKHSKQKNVYSIYVEYTQIKNLRPTKQIGSVILKNTPKSIKI